MFYNSRSHQTINKENGIHFICIPFSHNSLIALQNFGLVLYIFYSFLLISMTICMVINGITSNMKYIQMHFLILLLHNVPTHSIFYFSSNLSKILLMVDDSVYLRFGYLIFSRSFSILSVVRSHGLSIHYHKCI